MCAVAGAVALASVGFHVIEWQAPTQNTLTLYQKNLLFRNPDLSPLSDEIAAFEPDFITFQEVSIQNASLLGMLAQTYPTQVLCRFATVGGTAVLSRWPAIPGQQVCSEGQGIAAIQVETPDGPLWVVSLHLHWPWPYRQAEQLGVILPQLASLDGPVAIGGDFNMVRWSSALRRINEAAGTRPAGAARISFSLFDGWLPLPIDHVLIPKDGSGSSELRSNLGSDHGGILTKFVLKP